MAKMTSHFDQVGTKPMDGEKEREERKRKEEEESRERMIRTPSTCEETRDRISSEGLL